MRTRTSGGVVTQNILCRNGNEIVLKGGVGVVRILDNDCTIECATFSSDPPFTCNYNTLSPL